MTLRRPPRWVLMLLGGLTVAALLAWWWSEYIRTSTVRLADGRDVRVTAVTYGTNHVFIEGPLWVRAFRRQMSAAKAARFGLRVHQRSSAAPTCMVWTSWRMTAAMVTNRTTPFASIANAQGIESQPIGPTVLSWILGRGGSTALMGWQWENFPRGHRKIQVRFYDLMTKDGGYRAPTLAGEVAVHIPAGRSGGQPVPAPPPPVRVSDGNTEFSLVSLRCVERTDSPPEPSRPVAPLTTAMFSVVENAWPSTAWTLISLEGLGDAGNHFRIPEEGFGSVRRSFNRFSIEFRDVLWPEEPNWKIIAEFARVAEYAPEQLFTVRNVPIRWPTLGVTTSLSVEANGIALQTVDLRGTGRVWPYRRGAAFPNVDMVVGYTAKVDRARLDLAKVTDDQGRSLRFSYDTHPWKGQYTVALELPTNSASLDLTFASHRTRIVEFRVKPVWTNSAEEPPR